MDLKKILDGIIEITQTTLNASDTSVQMLKEFFIPCLSYKANIFYHNM